MILMKEGFTLQLLTRHLMLKVRMEVAALRSDHEAAMCKVITDNFKSLPTRSEMAILRDYGFTAKEVYALIQTKLPYMLG